MNDLLRSLVTTLLRKFTKEEILAAIEELTAPQRIEKVVEELPPLGISVGENLGLGEKVG